MVVEEGWPHSGVGANLATLIQEQAFDLDARPAHGAGHVHGRPAAGVVADVDVGRASGGSSGTRAIRWSQRAPANPTAASTSA